MKFLTVFLLAFTLFAVSFAYGDERRRGRLPRIIQDPRPQFGGGARDILGGGVFQESNAFRSGDPNRFSPNPPGGLFHPATVESGPQGPQFPSQLERQVPEQGLGGPPEIVTASPEAVEALNGQTGTSRQETETGPQEAPKSYFQPGFPGPYDASIFDPSQSLIPNPFPRPLLRSYPAVPGDIASPLANPAAAYPGTFGAGPYGAAAAGGFPGAYPYGQAGAAYGYSNFQPGFQNFGAYPGGNFAYSSFAGGYPLNQGFGGAGYRYPGSFGYPGGAGFLQNPYLGAGVNPYLAGGYGRPNFGGFPYQQGLGFGLQRNPLEFSRSGTNDVTPTLDEIGAPQNSLASNAGIQEQGAENTYEGQGIQRRNTNSKMAEKMV